MQKIILITGASTGIGAACAKLFHKAGYFVINASRTDRTPLENNYLFIKTDVSKEEDIKNLFDTIYSKFDKIDILINNAGFARFADFVDTKTEDFDDMFAVNVKGLYLCTRYALPKMIENKDGTIINISSIAGKNGVAKASIYSATKHAVMGFTKSLMMEVRTHNIRVIAICPGTVDTDFFSEGLSSAKDTVLSPEDVAEVVFTAANLPQRALINEIEIRPNNPQ